MNYKVVTTFTPMYLTVPVQKYERVFKWWIFAFIYALYYTSTATSALYQGGWFTSEIEKEITCPK